MPRLNIQLINDAVSNSFLNPQGDLEMTLNGLKLKEIENFAIIQDRVDAINISDNEIKYLGNFSPMNRLKHLYICNNYIEKIDSNISNYLPNLI